MVGSPKHRREESIIRDGSMRYLEDLGWGICRPKRRERFPTGSSENSKLRGALATRPQLLLLDEPAAE